MDAGGAGGGNHPRRERTQVVSLGGLGGGGNAVTAARRRATCRQRRGGWVWGCRSANRYGCRRGHGLLEAVGLVQQLVGPEGWLRDPKCIDEPEATVEGRVAAPPRCQGRAPAPTDCGV